MQRLSRIKKEFEMFETSPPPGISCCPKDDSTTELEADCGFNCGGYYFQFSEGIIGSKGTPYENGIFKLAIHIPDRYPFEPPKVHFVTPIYHPNIDLAGRICLDILKMPPSGGWRPCLNILTVLSSIQLLMTEPNPEDPLLAEVADEFKFNRSLFDQKAADFTQKYAIRK